MRPLLCLLSLLLMPVSLAGQGAQQAADRAAFLKARGVGDPAARVAALKAFKAEYPGSALADRAGALELDTLLAAFPERTAEIHALAAAEVAAAPAGFERWSEEARLADALASAGRGGADLVDAKTWSGDAAGALTEESYRRQMRLVELRYKLPPLTALQRHKDFVRTRASFLAALANVNLRTGDPAGATRALAEAAKLDPLSSEVSSLQGQQALARGDDHEALADFERSEAEGDLKEPWRAEMVRLYGQLHTSVSAGGASAAGIGASGSERGAREEVASGEVGGDAGLAGEIDALYGKLFPPLYALSPRRLPAGGHTVLLELFTGAGCEPCVAPDLAVESLLGTYARADLAVLEFDEHIPRPDPLTNPDGEERAAAYRVAQTPQAFLDGEEIPVGGASRADVENVVVGFADAIEGRAAVTTGVKLDLTAGRGADGSIVVKADAAANGATPTGGAALPSRVVVRAALVEDHVRYSGENGIRFHRMVVRAMAPPRAVELKAPSAMEASFDPARISREQVSYLQAYEKSNDRFGEFRFRSTEIPIDGNWLSAVAWIEDPATHEVLQTAFAVVPPR